MTELVEACCVVQHCHIQIFGERVCCWCLPTHWSFCRRFTYERIRCFTPSDLGSVRSRRLSRYSNPLPYHISFSDMQTRICGRPYDCANVFFQEILFKLKKYPDSAVGNSELCDPGLFWSPDRAWLEGVVHSLLITCYRKRSTAGWTIGQSWLGTCSRQEIDHRMWDIVNLSRYNVKRAPRVRPIITVYRKPQV